MQINLTSDKKLNKKYYVTKLQEVVDDLNNTYNFHKNYSLGTMFEETPEYVSCIELLNFYATYFEVEECYLHSSLTTEAKLANMNKFVELQSKPGNKFVKFCFNLVNNVKSIFSTPFVLSIFVITIFLGIPITLALCLNSLIPDYSYNVVSSCYKQQSLLTQTSKQDNLAGFTECINEEGVDNVVLTLPQAEKCFVDIRTVSSKTTVKETQRCLNKL